MTLTIAINPGPAAFWAVFFVSMVTVGVVAFFAGRVATDRAWEADIRRRVASTLEARWIAPAPADVIERPDVNITVFRPRRFVRDDQNWAA